MAIADHQEWFYLSPFNLSTKQINNQSKYKLFLLEQHTST